MTSTRTATLRLGTRGSALALAQARIVAGALGGAGLPVEIVTITTKGDVRTDVPLSVIGGRGVFAAELEQALRVGEVDLAVHSAKDLPSTLAPDLALAAFLPREDVRDVLIARGGAPLVSLPMHAVLGTSSPRRACQIRALRPDIVLRDIRGNVDTRLRKLDEGQYDAIVLAAAGLRRLGLTERVTQWLESDIMLPAVGQGAIAVEVRAADAAMTAALAPLDDHATRVTVTAERAFLARLGAGCAAPSAAHARLERGMLHLEGLIGSESGAVIRAARTGREQDAAALGVAVAETLLASGGEELLRAAGTRVPAATTEAE
ncbi:Porphobilinogen deaminase [Gemmatirosa kalamazoonensis]|uniref:Porphobilinogen deaminase n=1 Tax=Gemmatirosa kalamazoonensis TaxID=861299 RepID=W0RQJ8_9BACT|nr:hydroxymethylbilane synthase [Gemmatirosa kalamazoonensis]AHG91813.1 Porphobilinogen deaminase [Gemmatirosa kalamazoonensis]